MANNAVLFHAERAARVNRERLARQQRWQTTQQKRAEKAAAAKAQAKTGFRGTQEPVVERGTALGRDPTDLEWWLFSYIDPDSETGERVDIFIAPRPGDSVAGTRSRIARALAESEAFNKTGKSISDMFVDVVGQLDAGVATLIRIK